MRRALAAMLCLALLGALAIAPGSAGTSSGRAGAAECLWHRHAKRVVRQVRRHGRPRRIVRIRHSWSCDQAPVPAPGAPPPSPPAASPPTVVAEPEPLAHQLTVRAADNYYTLTRAKVAAGEVTIELANQGQDPHNLNLKRVDGEGPELHIPETSASAQSIAEIDLPPGHYRLWCSLLEHDKEGMNAQLVVLGG